MYFLGMSDPSSPELEGAYTSEAQRLRERIERLQQELKNRQAEPRPLPSSVMRAYHAIIDNYFAELTQLEPEEPSK